MKILVTIPPTPRSLEQSELLKHLFSSHEIQVVTTPEDQTRLLPTADILLSNAFVPVRQSDLEQASNLRFIQVLGVGVDHVDVATARDSGITVASVAGANTTSVAEHVILSILLLYRPLIESHTRIAQGDWPLSKWMNEAEDLEGKIVGIFGMGRIGRELAKRLLPFGVGIVYHDMVRISSDDENQLGITYLSKEELLPICDIITLHLPYTPNTHHFLSHNELFAMKQGSVLVNAARAELINSSDLVAALQQHLRGAALDVFASEPPAKDDPLLSLPNVILTPHGAGTTAQAQARIAQRAIQNVLRFLDGRTLEDVIVEARA